MTTPAASPAELDLGELLSVIRRMRRGDLGGRLPTDLVGIGGEIAAELNAHLEQMGHFTRQVSGASIDVSSGKLGAQVDAPAEGNWFNVKTALNAAFDTVTTQARSLRLAIDSLSEGNFNAEMAAVGQGEWWSLRERYNRTLYDLRSFRAEIHRLSEEIRTGNLGGGVQAEGARGEWRTIGDELTEIGQSVTRVVRNANDVLVHLQRGGEGRRMTVEAQSEFQMLKQAINDLADRVERTQVPA